MKEHSDTIQQPFQKEEPKFAQVIYASALSLTSDNIDDDDENMKMTLSNISSTRRSNQDNQDNQDKDDLNNCDDNENDENDTITNIDISPDKKQQGENAEENAEGEIQTEISLHAALKRFGRNEAKEMFHITWPIIISNLCSALLGTVDVAFVGHLGDQYLAAAGLANAYFSCIGFIPVGLLAAQDTMISQAEGMGNEHVKRIILGRSFLIMTVVTLPVAALFWFSRQILTLIGLNAEIAALSGVFNRYLIIGLYPYVVTNILTRYLTAQGRVIFPMICNILANGVNILLNSLLVQGIGYKGLGFIGAPIATSLTRTVTCMFTIAYTLYVERKDAKRRKKEQSEESLSSPSTEIIATPTAGEETSIELPSLEENEQEKQEEKEVQQEEDLENKPSRMSQLKKDFLALIAWQGIAEYLKLAIPGMYVQFNPGFPCL